MFDFGGGFSLQPLFCFAIVLAIAIAWCSAPARAWVSSERWVPGLALFYFETGE